MDEQKEQEQQQQQPVTEAEKMAAQEATIAALRQELEQGRRQAAEQGALVGLKFSSKSAGEAFLARLRAEKLPLAEGALTGTEAFIERYRGEDPAAFGATELPRVVEATPGGPQTDSKAFAAMSYSQRLKLQRENPQRYKELAHASFA